MAALAPHKITFAIAIPLPPLSNSMESKAVTLESLIDTSPSVRSFVNDKLSLTPEVPVTDFVVQDANYARIMVMAMEDKAYSLISGVLSLVARSKFNDELLGFALFRGHLSVTEALLKKDKLTLQDARLGQFTKLVLKTHFLLSSDDLKEHDDAMNDPIGLALLSDNEKVIDYVATRVRPLTSADFVSAVKYGRLASAKRIHHPSIKAEKMLEALELSLSSSWTEGIEYLLPLVPVNAFKISTVMYSLEQPDTKIFKTVYSACYSTLSAGERDDVVKTATNHNYADVLAVIKEFSSTPPSSETKRSS